jgi:hypothetical protein
MRKPQHPSAFADLKPILDAALAAGGASYRPRDHFGKHSVEAAHRFRHRAYAFRRSLQYFQEQEGMGLTAVSTPYDGMVLRIDPLDPTVVLINKPDNLGDLRGLDGQALKVGASPSPIASHEDPLVEQARKQAKELGIEL